MSKKNLVPKSRAKTAYGLLSDVVKAIAEEPKRYDQGRWRITLSARDMAAYARHAVPAPACGTIGCVAGWVVTLKRKRLMKTLFGDASFSITASGLLGLDWPQAEELFGVPTVFDGATPQTRAYARIGVKHIRRFQKKHRAQLIAKKV